MRKEHFEYLSKDGITTIHAVKWIPEGTVQAILQIAHGMVEFIERYEEFAEFLATRGILVVGNDHLGHGHSIRSKEHYGFFAEENGNRALLMDIHQLRQMACEEYPEVPYFILGHSMGSFLVRQYLCTAGEGIAGAIIMGTGYFTKPVLVLGLMLCEAEAKRKGWNGNSELLDLLIGKVGMNRIMKKDMGSDWLTRDQKIVEKYVTDERCRFRFTINGYYHMMRGINRLTSRSRLAKMPKDMPVYIMSGEDDPVGRRGAGVRKVYDEFLSLGMTDVRCKLYPDDRHEILNELDRDQVYEDIAVWMKEQMEKL